MSNDDKYSICLLRPSRTTIYLHNKRLLRNWLSLLSYKALPAYLSLERQSSWRFKHKICQCYCCFTACTNGSIALIIRSAYIQCDNLLPLKKIRFTWLDILACRVAFCRQSFSSRCRNVCPEFRWKETCRTFVKLPILLPFMNRKSHSILFADSEVGLLDWFRL